MYIWFAKLTVSVDNFYHLNILNEVEKHSLNQSIYDNVQCGKAKLGKLLRPSKLVMTHK